jgi:hypothetical protein
VIKNHSALRRKARLDSHGKALKSEEKKSTHRTRYRPKPARCPRFSKVRFIWWLRLLKWREIPWWGQFFIILGIVSIFLVFWFYIRPYYQPPPTYHLSASVSPVDGGEVSISPGYLDYQEGSQVTLNATAAIDWEFIDWSGDISGYSSTVSVIMDSDKEITANFRRIIRYALTTSVSPSGGGEVNPSVGVYDTGSSVILTATPAANYEFVSWSGDISAESPVVKVYMDSDKEITADFRIIQYTFAVTVNPIEGGEVSPSSGIYEVGSSVTMMAQPTEDYDFVYWSGDVRGTNPVVTLDVDSDKEVTANFTRIIQEIKLIMPVGISASVDTFSNVINSGDTIEGFVEITGEFKSYDRDFAWTFEILGPEGRRIEYKRGHWLRDNHYDFSFKAPYSGSYKIRVRHNSLHEKELLIKIRPMGWQ